MRIKQTVGSEVIHETGFDDTFYYFGNERIMKRYQSKSLWGKNVHNVQENKQGNVGCNLACIKLGGLRSTM